MNFFIRIRKYLPYISIASICFLTTPVFFSSLFTRPTGIRELKNVSIHM